MNHGSKSAQMSFETTSSYQSPFSAKRNDLQRNTMNRTIKQREALWMRSTKL
jgi:hypothetical protein